MSKTLLFDSESQGIRALTGLDPVIMTCKDCGNEFPSAPKSRSAAESTCWACLTWPGCKGDFAAAFFKDGPLMKRLKAEKGQQ